VLKNLETMENVQNKIMFKDTFRLEDRREFEKGRGVVEIQATCPSL
jgi:hypothetical protein